MAEKAQGTEPSSQAPAAVKTPIYEVGFHIVPAVGDDGVQAVVEKIRNVIGNAEIIAEGAPAKMSLAYTIERATAGKREKFTESYFGWIKFATERENIAALEEALRNNKEVLRSIVINTVREDISTQPRRAVFASDRLEGETIKAPTHAKEEGGEISEADLDKSIEALTG